MFKILQKDQAKKYPFLFPRPQIPLFHYRKKPNAQSSPNPCWTLPVTFLFLICVKTVSMRMYSHLSSGDGVVFARYQIMNYDKSSLVFICSYWAHSVLPRQVSKQLICVTIQFMTASDWAVFWAANGSFSSWNWKTHSSCLNYEIKETFSLLDITESFSEN